MIIIIKHCKIIIVNMIRKIFRQIPLTFSIGQSFPWNIKSLTMRRNTSSKLNSTASLHGPVKFDFFESQIKKRDSNHLESF